MGDLSKEAKVYSDFLTNLAVAWFSAGVIAPLFTEPKATSRFLASLIGIFYCFVSLTLAASISKGGK